LYEVVEGYLFLERLGVILFDIDEIEFDYILE
jgi:hypothetical protein